MKLIKGLVSLKQGVVY